jgi:hypothetical protein
VSTFWDKAKQQEVVINLADKLSKLELKDIEFIYNLIMESEFKGGDLETATAVLLKVKFIRSGLVKGNKDAENSKADDSGA